MSLQLRPVSGGDLPKPNGQAMNVPPVVVFGLTWMLGMLAVTVYLTQLG